MYLHEYQTKYLFAKHGLPIPKGYICNSLNEIKDLIINIGDSHGPWVAKCQIHAGGRGKADGVKVLHNRQEIQHFITKWLGNRLVTYQTNISGQIVNHILLEEFTTITKELYLGIIIDRTTHHIVVIASTEGGVDIEQTAKTMPDVIYKVSLDPLIGPQLYQGRELGFKLGLTGDQINQFKDIFIRLTKLFIQYDLSMIEINPLVINKKKSLICLDGKLSIDDNALYRQSELCQMRDYSQEDEREVYASKQKLNYVALNGNIGCMVNGAGLAMGTMDIIQLHGGQPANFLDVGGNATQDSVAEAFKIILLDKKVKVILVNIFGGIVRCDLIAIGIIDVISKITVQVPIVVRLEGNNAVLGIQLLINSKLNIIASTSLIDAVHKVINIAETNDVYSNK